MLADLLGASPGRSWWRSRPSWCACTFAISLTMNRSPGPIFSLAGKQTATTSTSDQRGLHQVVEPLAEQRARPVQAGGVDQDQLGVGAVHDAAYDGARGLRLVGGDHDLAADQRVGQRRLAGVGPADERGEPAAVLGRLARSSSSLASSYSAQICSSDLPAALPARQIGPGSTARGWRWADTAPVAHHVVRRARQPTLAHQVLADRAHLRRLPRHPEVAVAGRPVDRPRPPSASALGAVGRAAPAR